MSSPRAALLPSHDARARRRAPLPPRSRAVHGAADEEAIHDLRVAIRRLRTLLKLARPVFGRHYADAVRAAFTVVHRATGALRDEVVLEETLETITNDAPAFVARKMRRRARERALRRSGLARLRTGDLTRARSCSRRSSPSRCRRSATFPPRSSPGARWSRRGATSSACAICRPRTPSASTT